MLKKEIEIVVLFFGDHLIGPTQFQSKLKQTMALGLRGIVIEIVHGLEKMTFPFFRPKIADNGHLIVQVHAEGKLFDQIIPDYLILFRMETMIHGGEDHKNMVTGNGFVQSIIGHRLEAISSWMPEAGPGQYTLN